MEAKNQHKPPVINVPLTFELKLDPDHPWFKQVGLLPHTVKEFGLGYCSKGMMGGRIAFPIRNKRGDLIGYAGRWPGDNPPDRQDLWKYPKDINLDLVIYPAEKVTGSDPSEFLLAGDPLQVVQVWQLGMRGVVCIPSQKWTEATWILLRDLCS